jgi:hypothetical protein
LLSQDIGRIVIRSDVPQQDVLAVLRELAGRDLFSIESPLFIGYNNQSRKGEYRCSKAITAEN